MKLIVSVIGEVNWLDIIFNDFNVLYEVKKVNIILKKLDMGGNDFVNI